MKKESFSRDAWLILLLFVVSRVIVSFFGIHLEYKALFQYWQYLDVETLRHHLLRGVWYDHAQPPLFNIFLGIVLKLSGSYAPVVFSVIFKGITLTNTFLLLTLLKRLVKHPLIPLALSLLYLLSPATMITECELFYTSFITMMLLWSCFFLLRLGQEANWKNSIGFFGTLVIICLTRSMYHLVWLVAVGAILLVCYRKKAGFGKLLVCSLAATLLVGSWYLKNYIIFKSFSTSTWIGMNLARNVFHDDIITDSSKIGAYKPFSDITVYKPFLTGNAKQKYRSLNDRDLLQPLKNDSFTNLNHIDYMEVSQKYLRASEDYIKAHPFAYLKNVVQSCIIYFAPATRYTLTEREARKIKYYDLIYSFNLSHFATGKQQRRIALTISAFPKMLVYLFVFFLLIRTAIREKRISLLNLFIIAVIGYIFTVSSLLEHYENMRFRFEAEPLFLLLLAQVLTAVLQKKRQAVSEPGV